MRASKGIRPPGIYLAADEPRGRPLEVASTRVAGFVGLSEMGPVDEPCLVRSWQEYVETYGSLSAGYLDRAVEGFFINGGERCYVVRIAHRPPHRGERSHKHAASAEWVVPDGFGRPTLRVAALNEGVWGNRIWVKWIRRVGANTLLTLDVEVGVGEAQVNSVRGIERGSLVRIYDRDNSDHVVVTEVGDHMIRWGAETPLHHRYQAAGPTHVEVVEVEVHASLKERREVFRGLQLSPLSRHYVPRVVSDQSRLIRVEDLASRSPLPHALPPSSAAVRLSGGRDGNKTLSVEDFVGEDRGPGARTGLQALGSVDAVALLAVPDAMLAYRWPGPQADHDVQRIQDAMISLCENLQDRFAILDAPPTRNIEELRKWRLRYETSFAALYYPWLRVERAPGQPIEVPPSGCVAGVMARCDREFGVHKAPGNEVIRGAIGLSIDLREDDIGILTADGINPIRGLAGRGVRTWSARTLAEDADWRYVNVRRLFIMLRRSLEAGTQWAVFEPNHPSTWETLTREVTIFLEKLWNKGYFAGNTPAESFFVHCNRETNSPEVIDAGRLVMDIGVAPSVPAEYLIFSIAQKMGDQIAEAAG